MCLGEHDDLVSGCVRDSVCIDCGVNRAYYSQLVRAFDDTQVRDRTEMASLAVWGVPVLIGMVAE